MGNTLYRDGDPPVNHYNNFLVPGFAYYEASQEGNCKHCDKPTNSWLVSIKEAGHYICRACDTARKANNEARIASLLSHQ